MLITVFTLAVIGLLGATLLRLSTAVIMITAGEGDKMQAEYAALTGISRTLAQFASQPELLPGLVENQVVLAGAEGLFQAETGCASAFSDVLLLDKESAGEAVALILAVSGSCRSARVNLKIKAVFDLATGRADIIFYKT